jgi:hypothetical protein
MRRKIWTASDVTPGAPKGRETETFEREVSNPNGGIGAGGEGLDGRRQTSDKVHSGGDATGT